MSPQQKIAERIYELLPHKKRGVINCERCIAEQIKGGSIPCIACSKFQHYEPLRLADILLAIKKHITVTEDKDWLPFDVLCRKVIIQNHYNLEKDNILDQSDEFCEFLLELLK